VTRFQRLHKHRFLREEAGGGATEFALVVIVFVTLVLGIIDFSRALWQYNRIEKAVQLGARYAITHDLVAPGLETIDGIALGAGGNGLPVPLGSIAPVVCTWSGSKASCTGGYGDENQPFLDIVEAMRIAYPQVENDQVTITYEHIGLGFAGNPFGSDVTPSVTVALAGFQMVLLTPGLSKIASIAFGEVTATLTGESYGFPAL
jgi:Flp pilus assembly pilin Flp